MEETKLNLFQKIQRARVELQNKGLKKSGYNKIFNYKYFELFDFLPAINEICDNLGLYCETQYLVDKATLEVFNVDDGTSRKWEMPIEVASLKGCSMIQNIGGTQSYARRYLYMMAFEVAESDMLDGGMIDEDKEEGKAKISKAAVTTINILIDETKTDPAQFLRWANVQRVEDITNEMLGTCMNQLKKKKDKLESKAKNDSKATVQEQMDF